MKKILFCLLLIACTAHGAGPSVTPLIDTNGNLILPLTLNGTFSGNFVAPTNQYAVTLVCNGTNYTWQGNSPTTAGLNVSNACSLSKVFALVGVTNEAIFCGAGIFDISCILSGPGKFLLQDGTSFYGSGKGTLFVYTNDQSIFPIQPGANSEMGNFSCYGALRPGTQKKNNIHFFNISFVPVNNYGGTSNRAIDAVYLQTANQCTNTEWDSIYAEDSFDTLNSDGGIGVNMNLGFTVVFNSPYFYARSDTNTVSWIQRAAAFNSGTNGTYIFNGGILRAEQIVTNSPNINPIFSTNDCSAFEFGLASMWNKAVFNGTTLLSTSTTTNPFSINFVGGTNVVVDNGATIDLTKVNWAGRSNAIVFPSPAGWTNYIQDGVTYSGPLTNSVIPTPLAGVGQFYLSNYDLYWVTPNTAKLIVLGH
ncbi:MAG TPA: hypothetical protein VKV04_20305 [Verrucomicrobiae bacterium]|nr:hypothetical protein [Verrucomicrobiae bacterium]